MKRSRMLVHLNGEIYDQPLATVGPVRLDWPPDDERFLSSVFPWVVTAALALVVALVIGPLLPGRFGGGLFLGLTAVAFLVLNAVYATVLLARDLALWLADLRDARYAEGTVVMLALIQPRYIEGVEHQKHYLALDDGFVLYSSRDLNAALRLGARVRLKVRPRARRAVQATALVTPFGDAADAGQ